MLDALPESSTSPIEHSQQPQRPQRSLLILGGVGLIPFIVFHWIIQSYLRVVIWPWMLIWEVGFVAIFVLGIVLLRQFRYPVQLLGYGLDWFVGVLLLSLGLSTLFAPFPPVALWNVSRVIGFLLLLYVGRNCLNDDRFQPRLQIQSLWFGVLGVGLVTAIISLGLWRPSPEMWLSDEFNDAIRNHLPLGNNNFMGGYGVLLFPLAVMFPFAYRDWRRIFGIVASLASALLLYSSGSRGALLGAIVIVTLLVCAALVQSKGKQRIVAIVSGILGFILMGIALFSNPRIRQFLVAGGVQEAIDRILSDGPILDRIIMLQSLGNLFQHRPLTGVGPGNMSLVYNLYRPIESGNWSMHVQQLHNTPAQFLGELGILGLLAYVGFLLYFIWINFRLYPHWQSKEQRCLALGVNISVLGYATSSLTDYQLENIGIVTLLMTNLWLWIGLVDLASQSNPAFLSEILGQRMPGQLTLSSPRLRRLLSVGLLILLGVFSVIWLPINAASAISQNATRQAILGDLAGADQNWNLAAQLTPWDPVYPVIAAQKLLDLKPLINEPEDQKAIEEQIIAYYRQAVQAAPNDGPFQQNLAVVLLDNYPTEARDHALRSVDLQNRDITYAYYTLGLAYLKTGEQEKAIDAFVLQALNLPKILTLTLDSDARLTEIKSAVLQRSLQVFQQFLDSTSPDTPGYDFIQEQVAIVRWWHQDLSPQELANITDQPLRPMAKAVILAESQPQIAIDSLNTVLSANPQSLPELCLRAWIDPETYFEAFATALDTPEQTTAWKTSLEQYRDLREWFRSSTAEESYVERLALWLTYRNLNAINATKTLIPADIQVSRIAQDLQLHPPLPRYFPELDRFIYDFRTTYLQNSHLKNRHLKN